MKRWVLDCLNQFKRSTVISSPADTLSTGIQYTPFGNEEVDANGISARKTDSPF